MLNKQWVYVPKPEKFTKAEKEEALYKITKCIEEIEELKCKVKRADMKAGRVYPQEAPRKLPLKLSFTLYINMIRV